MVRKVFAVILSCLLLASSPAVPGYAAARSANLSGPLVATTNVTVHAPTFVVPGSNFTASIDINNVTNFDAASYDVLFNPGVLRLDGVTDGNIGGVPVPVDLWNQFNPGAFTIVNNVPGVSGATGSGNLAVLHFFVLGTAGQTSNITLTNGVLSDGLAHEIPATWVGGMVTVAGVLPLSVITAGADNITSNSARLNGNLTSLGGAPSATVALQWGLSANYTNETPVVSINGTGPFNSVVQGLSANTSYHFRAKAAANGPPASVSISGFAFNPVTLTVPARTKVTWTNNDSATHTVTSLTGVFDSGNLAIGASFSYVFSQAGTYQYRCTLHPSMTGTIIVAEGPAPIYGDDQGFTTQPVPPAALLSIAVTPNNTSIVSGQTRQFSATGTFADNSTANITGSVNWASSAPAVATINSAGLATAIAAGSATIIASSGGVSGNTTLTVTAPPLVSIVVTPANATIGRTQKQQFTATAYYSNSTNATITNAVTWSSNSTGVATVNATGAATGVGAGIALITASSGGMSGTAVLTVTATTTVEVNNGSSLILGAGQVIAATTTGGIPVTVKGLPLVIGGLSAPDNGLAGFRFDLSWNKNVITVNTPIRASTDALNAGWSITPGTPNNTTGTVAVTGFNTNYSTDNILLFYIGVTAVGSSGNSTSLNVAITSLGDKDGSPIAALPVNAPITILGQMAETGVTQGVSTSATDIIVVKANINRIKNPSDNSTANVTGGISAYSATVSGNPGNLIQFMTVYGVAPFSGPSFNATTGVFSVASATSAIQPSNTTVAEVAPILTGNTTSTVSLSIAFQSIGSASQPSLNIPEEHSNTLTFKRGDVKEDGNVDIFDALYIAQYIVGQRVITGINGLNAASVKHDGSSGDKIDIFDALFIAQYIVGQKNAYFQ